MYIRVTFTLALKHKVFSTNLLVEDWLQDEAIKEIIEKDIKHKIRIIKIEKL